MSDYMSDLSGILNIPKTDPVAVAKHVTNPKGGKSLEMQDFLQLMVTTLQNQTIDDTADISEMMNQMVQMSVIQAITNISDLVTQSTSLNYAASLVGKEVTIGQYDNGALREIVGTVTGTGTYDGKQVVFIGDDVYQISDVMAVGRLPSRGEEAVTDETGRI